jgi:hypothetical protein
MVLKLAFFIACAAPTALSAFALDFPDSSGKIVGRAPNYVIRLVETPGSNLKTAEALFVIKGSTAACLAVISDFEHYPDYMPNVHFAKYVGKKDSCDLYNFVFRIAWKSIRYCNSFRQNPRKGGGCTITWTYVGGDLKENSGSWDIAPFSGQAGFTIVHYRIYIDVGMFVPGWIRDHLMAKSIPKMINAVSEQVKGGEDQSPPATGGHGPEDRP